METRFFCAEMVVLQQTHNTLRLNSPVGLSWTDSAERVHTREMRELKEYVGERAQAGRMVPKGFPRNGKFG